MFSDSAGCSDAGNLLRLPACRRPRARAFAPVKVVKRNFTSGDERVDDIHEVSFWDKVRALEQLAKHFGLLFERIEVQHNVELVPRVQAARLRGEP